MTKTLRRGRWATALCFFIYIFANCHDGIVNPSLSEPESLLLFPGLIIDALGQRLTDPGAVSQSFQAPFSTRQPDTVTVLAPGETWHASATAFVWHASGLASKPISDGVSQAVLWSSNDPAVVSVDRQGIVTAHRAGVATITVTSARRGDVTAAAAVKVLSAPNQFVQVAVGGEACGLTVAGALYCWGGEPNLFGPNSTLTDLGTQLVPSGESLATISVGEASAQVATGYEDWGSLCALGVSGRAYCQGRLMSGAGHANGDTSFTVPVDGGFTFTAISTGSAATCALDNAGNAYCWGTLSGFIGETSQPRFSATVPTLIPGDLHFKAISVARSACGIVDDGTAYCWTTTPKPVPGNVKFTQIAVGVGYACGVSTSNDAYCWGASPTGALGLGNTSSAAVPTIVPGGLKFASLSIARYHAGPASSDASIDWGYQSTCGLTLDGTGYCWGANWEGALGIGTASSVATPTMIKTSLRFSALSIGSNRGCGIAAGKMYCWGRMFGHQTDTPYVPTLMEAQPR